jgi:hypothetical protein
MLWVHRGGGGAPVNYVDADPHLRAHTFSPLLSHKHPVLPMIHTPTTSTILFFQ